MSYNNQAQQWVTDPAKRDQLFIDLTDATHPDAPVRLSELVGKVPCISQFAPKSQGEILRAMMQKMAAANWQGDRMVRVRGGVYAWQCGRSE